MIVTILHYYSSIITIIVKNDNILYVNYTIKTEKFLVVAFIVGTKQVKIASFFIKTSFSFAKNGLNSCLRPGCKSHGHPGVEEVQIRVCAKLFRGCGDVYLPC